MDLQPRRYRSESLKQEPIISYGQLLTISAEPAQAGDFACAFDRPPFLIATLKVQAFAFHRRPQRCRCQRAARNRSRAVSTTAAPPGSVPAPVTPAPSDSRWAAICLRNNASSSIASMSRPARIFVAIAHSGRSHSNWATLSQGARYAAASAQGRRSNRGGNPNSAGLSIRATNPAPPFRRRAVHQGHPRY